MSDRPGAEILDEARDRGLAKHRLALVLVWLHLAWRVLGTGGWVVAFVWFAQRAHADVAASEAAAERPFYVDGPTQSIPWEAVDHRFSVLALGVVTLWSLMVTMLMAWSLYGLHHWVSLRFARICQWLAICSEIPLLGIGAVYWLVAVLTTSLGVAAMMAAALLPVVVTIVAIGWILRVLSDPDHLRLYNQPRLRRQ